MDLLGDIMSAMDKNQKPSLSRADKNLQSKFNRLFWKMPGNLISIFACRTISRAAKGGRKGETNYQ
jgi:hypothetical protein